MAGMDVSYDANGDSLIVWFDRPRKTCKSEQRASGIIVKKDEKGLVIGVEYPAYFAGGALGGPGHFAAGY